MLRLVAGRVPLLIELKSSPLWPALERAVLDALHGYEGELAIQSFEHRTLRHLDRCDVPHVVGHLWRRRARPAVGLEPAFFGCPVDGLASRAVRRRREAGAVVLAWTVRSPEQAQRALRFVDNFIFEGWVPPIGPAAANGHALGDALGDARSGPGSRRAGGREHDARVEPDDAAGQREQRVDLEL